MKRSLQLLLGAVFCAVALLSVPAQAADKADVKPTCSCKKTDGKCGCGESCKCCEKKCDTKQVAIQGDDDKDMPACPHCKPKAPEAPKAPETK